jgi:Predicted kinase
MWKIIEQQNWENIYAQFQWIREMEQVPQDRYFHGEGNVAIHTQMVLNALLGLPEYQALTEQDQQVLFAAALLHDVEKRSTTKLEPNGRISSKGHARKGEYTARTLLYREIPCPFSIKEAVAKLVRYHGFPIWVLEKPDPQKALLKTALEVNTEHLSILAKADMLGRICVDQKDMLYRVDLFKEFCQEQNCFGQTPSFPSKLGRYIYFQKEEGSKDYLPFEGKSFEVILLSALPGTGKDYFIRKNYPNTPVISLDVLRRKHKISPADKKRNGFIGQTAKEEAKMFLRKKQSFIWNATNLTRKMRAQLIDLFQQYGAKTKLVYIEVPYPTLLEQNRNRPFPIPTKVLEKMILKLEVPAVWEAPEVENFIRE